MKRSKQLTAGNKIGLWKLLRPARTIKSKRRWHARCRCGTTRVVDEYSLVYGTSRSCGCRTTERDTWGKLLGKRFGRWTVTRRAPRIRNHGNRRWHVVCDCGKTGIVTTYYLTSGISKSCGCLSREKTIKRSTKHGEFIGRELPSSEYNTWCHLRARCYDRNNRSYAYYGGRGLRVCARWLGPNGFANFLADMGRKPSSQHSIGRVDNRKGYSPKNCRWETKVTQMNNRRNCINIRLNGVTKTLAEWARALGINRSTIKARLNRGWSAKKALTTPLLRKH